MFSVIVPTFNRPDMLARAIASIDAQEGVMVELIIVDDGDGESVKLARRLAPGSIVIDNRKRGQVRARNIAVAHASRPFIAFLDDDDEWRDPHHLRRAQTALEAGADLWFAGGVLAEAEGGELPFRVPVDAASLEHDNGILVSATCYRRDLHGQLGAFDEALPVYWDWDWFLRIARTGGRRLVQDPHLSALIRRHAGNVTRRGFETPRSRELQRFAAKHGLADLELKTHADLVTAAAE
jgi:glycosyltransferase involved in cell wall biosynthesis